MFVKRGSVDHVHALVLRLHRAAARSTLSIRGYIRARNWAASSHLLADCSPHSLSSRKSPTGALVLPRWVRRERARVRLSPASDLLLRRVSPTVVGGRDSNDLSASGSTSIRTS